MRRLTVKDMTRVAMLAALCLVLSLLENALPPLPIPAARLGLSNVAVTASAVLVSPLGAVMTAAVKVLFVFLTRGASAAWMAGCGTAAAVGMTLLLLPLQRAERLTFVGVSVASATLHTLGQLTAAHVMLTAAVWAYAPLLLLLSVPAGCITGLVLNVLIPRLVPLVQHDFKE